MKYIVKLPGMNWFQHGKVYSGSLGTDPMRGCTSCTTFNYRIKLVKDDTRQEFVAVCYFQLPWNSRTNITEFITGIFEVSDFGIEVAENWIRSQFFQPYQKNETILLEEEVKREDRKLIEARKQVQNRKINYGRIQNVRK